MMYRVAACLIALSVVLAFARQQPAEEVGIISLTGKLVCLGCGGKFHSKDRKVCSIRGQLSALKVAGKESATHEIRYYTFLPSDSAKQLIEDHALHGNMFEVKGVVFPGSQVIEVASFKEHKAN